MNPFEDALTAFELRFEGKLIAHWRELEFKAAKAIDECSLGSKKKLLLTAFFEEAGNRIAEDIHSNFPTLLQLGITHREQIGTQSLLDWVSARIRSCVFRVLGMDAKFDMGETADSGMKTVRDDSRVLRSALVASTRNWSLDDAPIQLRLPAWVGQRWQARIALARSPGEQDLLWMKIEPLSLKETKGWVWLKEGEIRRKIDQQIFDECLDGVIEGGRIDVSVLEPAEPLKDADSDAESEQSYENVEQKELSAEEIGKKRARDVIRAQREIAEIRGQMDRDDEYELLKKKYPKFMLFWVCDKNSELKQRALGIKSHHQRKALRFAKEVAAAYNGIKLNTIEKAWDQHNPNKKTRPKKSLQV